MDRTAFPQAFLDDLGHAAQDKLPLYDVDSLEEWEQRCIHSEQLLDRVAARLRQFQGAPFFNEGFLGSENLPTGIKVINTGYTILCVDENVPDQSDMQSRLMHFPCVTWLTRWLKQSCTGADVVVLRQDWQSIPLASATEDWMGYGLRLKDSVLVVIELTEEKRLHLKNSGQEVGSFFFCDADTEIPYVLVTTTRARGRDEEVIARCLEKRRALLDTSDPPSTNRRVIGRLRLPEPAETISGLRPLLSFFFLF